MRQDSSLPPPISPSKRFDRTRLVVFLVVLAITTIGVFQLRASLSLEELARQETQLREFQDRHPVLVYGAAALVYVVVTGLSLPGATILSLLYGWYFGFFRSLILVSFSSTAGATLAFLLSRHLFRDAIQRRFGDRLDSFNRSFEQDGAYFLFSLRLIPAIPFFVINPMMGLTPIRVSTFWWVSQAGMLPGTIVYLYAGSRVPGLGVLADRGLKAVFTPGQLTQIAIAFVILGLFPLAIRGVMKWVTPAKTQHSQP